MAELQRHAVYLAPFSLYKMYLYINLWTLPPIPLVSYLFFLNRTKSLNAKPQTTPAPPEPQQTVKAVSHQQNTSIFVCFERIKMLISLIKMYVWIVLLWLWEVCDFFSSFPLRSFTPHMLVSQCKKTTKFIKWLLRACSVVVAYMHIQWDAVSNMWDVVSFN